MILDISWPAVGSGCLVLSIVGKIIHGVLSSALEKRDIATDALVVDLETAKDGHVSDVKVLRATQKVLFDKQDTAVKDLQEYKLHVAETYIAEKKLEKILLPVERRLEAIENDLRGSRRERA